MQLSDITLQDLTLMPLKLASSSRNAAVRAARRARLASFSLFSVSRLCSANSSSRSVALTAWNKIYFSVFVSSTCQEQNSLQTCFVSHVLFATISLCACITPPAVCLGSGARAASALTLTARTGKIMGRSQGTTQPRTRPAQQQTSLPW